LETWDRDFSPTVTVAGGMPVEFRVTTLDVNHGFSLYAPDGHLVAQTQAMPGYMNRLRITFDQPGTYTVLCLEFCGMSHSRATSGRVKIPPGRLLLHPHLTFNGSQMRPASGTTGTSRASNSIIQR
jgi:hypothetical protein